VGAVQSPEILPHQLTDVFQKGRGKGGDERVGEERVNFDFYL